MRTSSRAVLVMCAILAGAGCVTTQETERGEGFIVSDGEGMIPDWEISPGSEIPGAMVVDIAGWAADGSMAASAEVIAMGDGAGGMQWLSFEERIPQMGRLVLTPVDDPVQGLGLQIVENSLTPSDMTMAMLEEAQKDLAAHADQAGVSSFSGAAIGDCRWGSVALSLVVPALDCTAAVALGKLTWATAGLSAIFLGSTTVVEGTRCIDGVYGAFANNCAAPTRRPGDPWIGVNYTPAPDSIYVNKVVLDGPADRAGILEGDRILAIAGAQVAGAPLPLYLDVVGVGNIADFSVLRFVDGAQQVVTVPVTVGAMPEPR